MAKSDEEKAAALIAGCLWIVLVCLICLPAWYVLLYTILDAIQAPTYAWVIYYVYLPCNFLAAIVTGLSKSILE